LHRITHRFIFISTRTRYEVIRYYGNNDKRITRLASLFRTCWTTLIYKPLFACVFCPCLLQAQHSTLLQSRRVLSSSLIGCHVPAPVEYSAIKEIPGTSGVCLAQETFQRSFLFLILFCLYRFSFSVRAVSARIRNIKPLQQPNLQAV